MNKNKDGRIELGIKLDAKMMDNEKLGDNTMLIEKRIGSVLDTILDEMEEQNLEVPAELLEFKQWLRFKGNSYREQGDYKYWDLK